MVDYGKIRLVRIGDVVEVGGMQYQFGQTSAEAFNGYLPVARSRGSAEGIFVSIKRVLWGDPEPIAFDVLAKAVAVAQATAQPTE